MSQNKPLSEYGDLHSVHHADKENPNDPQVEDETPARLVVTDGPGNLNVIKWTKGDRPIPFRCRGAWNHKGKAQEAIDGSVSELLAEERQALADAEAIEAAKEVAAEHARIQKEIDDERVQMEAAAAKAELEASKKATKKATATK